MKHQHHIIPRHVGGSDDPNNLVLLSVEEHAEAHRLLFEKHGYQADRCAWKGLSALIGKEDFLVERARLGGLTQYLSKDEQSKLIKQGQSLSNKKWGGSTPKEGNGFYKKHHTPESKQAMREKNKINSKGSKNSQFGTMWITNSTVNKKIKKDGSLPIGFTKGRI